MKKEQETISVVRKLFEKLIVPVESELLEYIKLNELVDKDFNVVIGTEEDFKLPKGLTNIHPKAKLTVIDSNAGVKEWEESAKLDGNIEVVVGKLGEGTIKDNEGNKIVGAGLVIAKHLMNFIPNSNKESAIEEMREMLKDGGALLISLPLAAKKQRKKIGEIIENMEGWNNKEKKEIGDEGKEFEIWELTKSTREER